MPESTEIINYVREALQQHDIELVRLNMINEQDKKDYERLVESVNDVNQNLKELKKEMTVRFDNLEKRVNNYPIVEKLVFTLIGIVLTAVATAVVALVIQP